MNVDVLSDVLGAIRFRGAIFFSVDASAPWVIEAPRAAIIAPHVMPGVDHVIEYHIIAEGSCWGGIVDEPATLLEAGDIIVFPQGDGHVMSSAPGMRNHDAEVFSPGDHGCLPIAISKEGGGAERVKLICGFLGCDARPFNPLLATLPRVIHIRGACHGNDVLHSLIQITLAESRAQRSGGPCVLSRLSELLFIEVVRRHVATVPNRRGWLSGLRDEYVGRALQKLHENPARAWTLNDLAKETGMSRSMLAERFTSYVGIPPIQYLSQWRMQLAASLLSSTGSSVAEVADRVGYGSEAALSRAFKRWVGVPPRTYRDGKLARTVLRSPKSRTQFEA